MAVLLGLSLLSSHEQTTLFDPGKHHRQQNVRVLIDGCPDQNSYIDGCPDQDVFEFASWFAHTPP